MDPVEPPPSPPVPEEPVAEVEEPWPPIETLGSDEPDLEDEEEGIDL